MIERPSKAVTERVAGTKLQELTDLRYLTEDEVFERFKIVLDKVSGAFPKHV